MITGLGLIFFLISDNENISVQAFYSGLRMRVQSTREAEEARTSTFWRRLTVSTTIPQFLQAKIHIIAKTVPITRCKLFSAKNRVYHTRLRHNDRIRQELRDRRTLRTPQYASSKSLSMHIDTYSSYIPLGSSASPRASTSCATSRLSPSSPSASNAARTRIPATARSSGRH